MPQSNSTFGTTRYASRSCSTSTPQAKSFNVRKHGSRQTQSCVRDNLHGKDVHTTLTAYEIYTYHASGLHEFNQALKWSYDAPSTRVRRIRRLMFSLILHEAGGVSESTLACHGTRQGVWETTCQHFSARDQHHNLAQELPGLPNEPIYQHESAMTLIGRSDATDTISTLTRGHWRPLK